MSRKRKRKPDFMARMQARQDRARMSAEQKDREWQETNERLGLGYLNRPIEDRTEDERRRDG